MAALAVLALLALTSSGGEAVRVLGAGLAAPPGATAPPAYVLAGQEALLQCRFALEARETLQGVTWTKDSHLVYRWLPHRVQAFGALENATEPGSARSAASGREWDVLVTKAATAMAGNYSCSVHTDRGSAASRRFHLDVLLVCKARIETEDSTGVNCTVGWRVLCARVFPDLNLTAGVFDPDEGKFFDRVTEWTKVVYSDNTYGYEAFKSYHVAEIPKSSIFLWSLSYRDQTPLVTGNVSSGAVHRAWSGCLEPPPVHEPSLHLRLLYGAAVAAVASREAESDSPSDCRGRPRGATRAIYTCANAANEIPDMAAAATTKELVCVDGEWRDADPLAPWPLC